MAPPPKKPPAIQGKYLGEVFFMDDLQPPSDTFPCFCLSNATQTLSDVNWPDLVPYLRDKALRVDPTGTNVTDFAVREWAVSDGIATLTLFDGEPERILFHALAQDLLTHGDPYRTDYPGWRSLTVPAPIGPIGPGDYPISRLEWWPDGARKLRFPYAAPDSWAPIKDPFPMLEFYPHRVAGNATQALHHPLSGRCFMSVGSTIRAPEAIGTLRRPDRLQQHVHRHGSGAHPRVDPMVPGWEAAWSGGFGGPTVYSPNPALGSGPPYTGDVGTVPGGWYRPGVITEPRNVGVFTYIYGRTYVP